MKICSSVSVAVYLSIASVLTMVPTLASAQTSLSATHPYGLDPYAPRDAAWLRTYGAALVAQTPTADLVALDPYKPSDAALLRQLGGAMPLCCGSWLWPGPGPVISALMPAPLRPIASPVAVMAPAPAAPQVSAAVATPLPAGPTSIATLARPQGNLGVSIRYAGQTWVSAGRSISLADTSFERIGEAAGAAVYRRPGAADDIIYVATRNNLVAPFRLSR